MLRVSIISSMICLLLAAPVYANKADCLKQAKMMTHLYPTVMTAELKSLVQASKKGDAYTLSMPLLISGYLGNPEQYRIVARYMKKALDTQNENTMTDWLMGRVLLADFAMHGKVTRTDLLITLQRHADFNKTPDNFMTWAIAYLAAVDYSYKDKMLKSAQDLTANKRVSKGDKLWAWVMVMNASAMANDKGTYLLSMDQINKLGGGQDVGESLLKGLSRTPESSDYPAWAISIARLSSATINDPIYFDSLKPSLDKSLLSVSKGSSEALLAQSNDLLAIQRMHANKACMPVKPPVNPEACAH